MTPGLAPALLLHVALLGAAPAVTTSPADGAHQAVRRLYGQGRFDEALRRAEELIDGGGLSQVLLIEIHLYAGAAGFNLEDKRSATRHFGGLLRLEPDYQPDPFEFSPPMLTFFDELRTKLGPELALIRMERRLSAKSAPAAAAPEVTKLEPPFSMHLLPLGAPQFEQGRRTAGWVFFSTQGLAASVSLATFLSYYGSMSRRLVDANGVLLTEWGISPNVRDLAMGFRAANLISTVAFWALYLAGAIDALVHRGAGVAVSVGVGPQGPSAQLSWGP